MGEGGGEEGVVATETTAPPLAVALAAEVDLEEVEGAFQPNRWMRKTGRGTIALFLYGATNCMSTMTTLFVFPFDFHHHSSMIILLCSVLFAN